MEKAVSVEFERKPEVSLERRGNVVTIKKPEGIYSMIYEAHFVGPKSEPQTLPRGLDGICLEAGGAKPYPASHKELLQLYSFGNHELLLSHAEANNLPAFAIDCSLSHLASVELLEHVIELGAGHVLFQKVLDEAKSGKMGRRRLLKLLLQAGAGLYLTLPVVSLLGRVGSSLSGFGEEQTAQLAKTTQRIHPEFAITKLAVRNTVSAQKMKFLLEHSDRSHLIAPRGTMHVRMEDMILASEEERLGFLRRIMPVLPKLVLHETFYKIFKYEVKSGEWEVVNVFEEPKLKRMWEGF